jgi:hypothetical protein
MTVALVAAASLQNGQPASYERDCRPRCPRINLGYLCLGKGRRCGPRNQDDRHHEVSEEIALHVCLHCARLRVARSS